MSTRSPRYAGRADSPSSKVAPVILAELAELQLTLKEFMKITLACYLMARGAGLAARFWEWSSQAAARRSTARSSVPSGSANDSRMLW